MAWIQRQYPRFEVSLPVELRPLGANAPLRTRTRDLCLGGLYVEMTLTQEVTTTLDIILWVGDVKISVKGEVVSKHPSFGNGIKFTQVSGEARFQLRAFLQTLQSNHRLHGPEARV
jgi:c-di-GMP-binding flagellar brake protein YcgR